MSLRQFWEQYVIVPNNRYRKVVSLSGHSGPVNCFGVFSSDILASGGDDQQVHIWDLNTATCRQTLQDRHGRWGQITTMVAIDDSVVSSPLLVLGTGRGKILVYKRSRNQTNFHETCSVNVFDHIDSVESLAYDSRANKLAVASHSAKLVLFSQQNDGTLSRVWKKQLGDLALPRMLHFIEQGTGLIVHTLEGGKVLYIDTDTANELVSTTLQTPIGDGDLCLTTKSVVIDNMATGFDLYNINRASPNRSYDVPVSRRRVKMVKFGENSTIVVGGSDHGAVYIFDTNTTELLQVLVHQASLIQALITYSTANEHVVISGLSDEGHPGAIHVWKKPTKRALMHNSGTSNGSLSAFLLMLLFGMTFIYLTDWSPHRPDAADILVRFKHMFKHFLQADRTDI